MTTDDDLDLIETERLVDALGRRSEFVVVVMSTNMTENTDGRSLWWRGGALACLGLAEVAHKRLLSFFFKDKSSEVD